jgi:MFS transporter, AAHS family, 4-hydroxybenzoate transporter
MRELSRDHPSSETRRLKASESGILNQQENGKRLNPSPSERVGLLAGCNNHHHLGEEMVADEQIVQVSRLLDERGMSFFQIKLLVWSMFVVLIDGYDIGAISFAAPTLVKSFGVAPSALGPVFSASLVGILFGSGAFGWVGDRFDRRAALISSMLWFGAFTLSAAYATNLKAMFWLRLLAGVGIGGVIPNVVAINIESAPNNLRATLALVAVGCVPIGGAIPGFVAATLVPHHGWQILFFIGGIAPSSSRWAR